MSSPLHAMRNGKSALHELVENFGRARREDLFFLAAFVDSRPPSFLDLRTAAGPLSKTALYIAVEKGLVGTVRTLIFAGASVEGRVAPFSWTPLLCATAQRHLPLVKTLLAGRPRLDLQGPLPRSTRHSNNWAQVTALGSACSPPYSYGPNGATNAQIARVLLNAGANANDGSIWLACQHGNVECLSVLLKFGAGIEVHLQHSSTTLLMVACQFGHDKVVSRLLEAGAKTESKDKYGMGALSYATRGQWSGGNGEGCATCASIIRSHVETSKKRKHRQVKANSNVAKVGTAAAAAAAAAAVEQWEDYYRKSPEAAVKAGYKPSAALKAEVEGIKPAKPAAAAAANAAAPAATAEEKKEEETEKKENEKEDGRGEGNLTAYSDAVKAAADKMGISDFIAFDPETDVIV